MEIKLLNVFQLKIIAIISMAVDHIAVMLGTNYIYYMPMRTIGRISYPIFAFLIANGWNKTKDKTAYISRVMIFAAVSAIPHMILFGRGKSMGFFNNGIAILYIIVFVCFMLFFAVNANKNKIMCIIFSAIYFFFPFFTGRRNVLYTFTYSMFVILFVEKIKKGFTKKGEATIITAITSVFDKKDILLIPMILAPALISGEYGFIGALLIVLLNMSKNDTVSAILIILWGIYEYVIRLSNITYFIPVVFAGLLCLMYNGKKGSDKKNVFYIFYPLHLLILGFIRIFCF